MNVLLTTQQKPINWSPFTFKVWMEDTYVIKKIQLKMQWLVTGHGSQWGKPLANVWFLSIPVSKPVSISPYNVFNPYKTINKNTFSESLSN